MNYCQKCGKPYTIGAGFCPSCGNELTAKEFAYREPSNQQTENGKLMAILAYIIFFIPLLAGEHRKSEFVRFHTNQGTILFIFAILLGFISSIFSMLIFIVPFIGILFSVLSGAVGLSIFALLVIGIVNAASDKMKPLPLIGKFNIIK